MANDYKRMWTKEEIKSNSVLELPDIPEVVDANSPDIIRVQGKLYYKEKDIIDKTTSYYFNETLPTSLQSVGTFYITFYSGRNFKFDYITFTGGGPQMYVAYGPAVEEYYVYTDGWVHRWYRTCTFVGDIPSGLQTILNDNAELVAKTDEKIVYLYKELGADEELVKSIPTDVSIIEDQGKLELMLEHDGNVLAVNDTPNQFLQRRLDKPSAEWNDTTSSEDFGSWYLSNKPQSNGTIFYFEHGSARKYYCIYTGYDTYICFAPSRTVTGTVDGFVYSVRISTSNNTISLDCLKSSQVVTETLSFNDISLARVY